MSLNVVIQTIALIALPLLFAITLHEAAHGWIASKLGDKTALNLGRVSLNPLRHIDWFGTVLLPIIMMIVSQFTFVFGWAKPVPVAWEKLNNPRRDMALVALAGPLSNLFMALFWALVLKLALVLDQHFSSNALLQNIIFFFQPASLYGIFINILLAILNLIPIPPLDGSRIVSSFLPPRVAHQYNKIEPYGILILMGLFFLGIMGKVLKPLIVYLFVLIKSLFHLV